MDNKKFYKLIENYELHCEKIRKATSIDISEKPEDKLKRIKNLEKNYIDWFEYYFPNYAKVKSADFHKSIADDIINNNEVSLLVEAYRSSGKSVHVDMGIPLCLYYTNRLKFMLLVGETEPKAKKLLSAVQAQVQYNQRLANDYGLRFKAGDWSDGDFLTNDSVRFVSLGFGQSPRGIREGSERPDYIVIDDIDTKKHVNNDELMRTGVDYVIEDIQGCFDEADNAIKRLVFCNNNFHKNSITNRLHNLFKAYINSAKENSEKTHYKIRRINAVKDLVDFIPNWPSKTSSEYWRKKYKNTPVRSFLREYMNTHVADGAIFKADNIQHKKSLPLKEYEALCVYGDLSYKDKADYKALLLVGKIGREFHVIKTFLRRTSRKNAAKWLYDIYEDMKLSKYNVSYYIEGLFAMDEFVNDFDIEGDERGYHIPVVADKRPKANKVDRIESLTGWFERNNVFFNLDEINNVDQIELIDQFLAFEKGSGANDDGPDAFHGAVDKLNRATFIEKFEPRFSKITHNEQHY